MSKIKQGVAIVFCGLLINRPAHALFPVFDFGEVIPVGSEVTTMAESLKKAKDQLMEIVETKGAIGFGQRISVFQKLTKKKPAEKASETVSTVSSVLKEQKTNSTKVNEVVTTKVTEQKEKNKKVIKDIIKLMDNKIIKKATDEEEKEDINEYVSEVFNDVEEENKKIVTEINEALDTTINKMNNGAEQNHDALKELSETLEQNTKVVDADKKAELQKKLDDLIVKEQKLSDRGISIIEAEKDRYNSEYKEKIEDGINNYKNTVQAYVNDTVSKEEVVDAGEHLKQNIEAFDVSPNTTVIENYHNDVLILEGEIATLSDEIKQLYSDDNS